MNESKVDIEIARLDGLIGGIALTCGKPRDYSAFCYRLELEEVESSVESSLANFFDPYAKLVLSSRTCLERGIGDLEVEIREYLLRDISHVCGNDLSNMQKFLSFRVMENVSKIIGDDRVTVVLKLFGKLSPSNSECVFFCVVLESVVLVLQFNNDIEFKKQNIGENFIER